MTRPLSPAAQAVMAAIDMGQAQVATTSPRVHAAQAFRALAFLRPTEPITNDQLIRIAEELDP